MGKKVWNGYINESSDLELNGITQGIYFMKFFGANGESKTFKLYFLE